MLSRRQLQGFVGLPSEGTIQLDILWFEAGVLSNARQHPGTNLISIMKRKNDIRPAWT